MKYRITKYNPSNRNENGSYALNEWTSYSDIGKYFENKVFTYNKYLETETKYINAVKSLMQFFDINSVFISDLEKHNELNDFNEKDKIFYPYYKKLYNSQKINIANIDKLIQLILREYTWCEIHLESINITVLFGNDYYMYFNINDTNDVSSLLEKIKSDGLFVD